MKRAAPNGAALLLRIGIEPYIGVVGSGVEGVMGCGAAGAGITSGGGSAMAGALTVGVEAGTVALTFDAAVDTSGAVVSRGAVDGLRVTARP